MEQYRHPDKQPTGLLRIHQCYVYSWPALVNSLPITQWISLNIIALLACTHVFYNLIHSFIVLYKNSCLLSYLLPHI